MDSIPPELIDSILHEVEDTKTLMACAIVASAFREPSQRILLHSATVGSTRELNYQTVSDILQKSAHIASYIRHLSFYLPSKDTPPATVDFLPELLAKFTHLSYLTVYGDGSPWDAVSARTTDAVEKLIQERHLKGLYIMDIEELPVNLLSLIFSSVSTFCSLGAGSIRGQASTTSIAIPTVPAVKNLLLCLTSASNVGTMLLRPH
ncbi:hypothetical protein B0H11DRAFT_1979720 [Mycena galericulata]|nr:hypothetical protein B0H11DRAFT_1979720 [Mycena galericulata]